MKMTHEDFEGLCDTSMEWKNIPWRDQEDRFEVSNGKYADPINFKFAYAYWLGENYTNVILAREYLTARGYPDHQVLWDMVDSTADWYLNELARLSHAAVGGEGVQGSAERAQALLALAEKLRGQHCSYVILSNFGYAWDSPERLDTTAYTI